MKKLKTTLNHLRRSPYQTLAAVVMTMVTFFIVTLFALIILGGRELLAYFESRPQVTAYFVDTATREDALKLEEQIKAKYSVDSSHYVSKNDALALYQEQNKADPLLLEMVTADILPSSLEVSAKNVADLSGIAELMDQDQNVEEVTFQKDVISVIESWIRGARLAGVTLSAILILASFVTIMIILGMRFTMRKGEIDTLSLLGATRWYIRAPFILEGALYGFSGAVLGWASAYTLLLYLTPNLVDFFANILVLPPHPLAMLGLLGGELALGGILGIFASLLATRRYGR